MQRCHCIIPGWLAGGLAGWLPGQQAQRSRWPLWFATQLFVDRVGQLHDDGRLSDIMDADAAETRTCCSYVSRFEQ